MISDTQRDIIALSMVPGLGPRRIMMLFEKAGDAGGLFPLSFDRLKLFMGDGAGKVFCGVQSVKRSREYDRELTYIERENIQVICYFDAMYPPSLRNIYDPPSVIYCKGTPRRTDINAVGIVGSRRCSSYGFQMAERLAFDLAGRGVTIVSGMARGIDEAAHRGAIKGGGRTIAVLGSGFRHLYPPGSADLASDIALNGMLMTEFTSDTVPFKGNFPRRNRIISGIAAGIVVVEAAERSGALITVDFALDQGREVFAVPGRADFYVSRGTNRLIQNGAKLVTSAEDILEELELDVNSVGAVKGRSGDDREKVSGEKILTGEQKSVIKILGGDRAVHIDQISETAGIDGRVLPEILLKMETDHLIKHLPGGSYVIAPAVRK